MNEVEIVLKEEERPKKRRGNLQVLVKILLIALKGARKTEIVYKANLNFNIGKKYLDFLLTKGLITEDSLHCKKKIYRTTEKGRMFIKRYRETVELIE